MSLDTGNCGVCEDPATGTQTQTRCPYCKWWLCPTCKPRHFDIHGVNMNHPAATGKCRGRTDTR